MFSFFKNINKAAGMDQIPVNFLKEAADVSACPLVEIINLFVKLYVFPKVLRNQCIIN